MDSEIIRSLAKGMFEAAMSPNLSVQYDGSIQAQESPLLQVFRNLTQQVTEDETFMKALAEKLTERVDQVVDAVIDNLGKQLLTRDHFWSRLDVNLADVFRQALADELRTRTDLVSNRFSEDQIKDLNISVNLTTKR